VIFEGDSMSVVSALSTENPCWSRYGHVIEDARVRMREIGSTEVQHVRRCANQAAYIFHIQSIVFAEQGSSFL